MKEINLIKSNDNLARWLNHEFQPPNQVRKVRFQMNKSPCHKGQALKGKFYNTKFQNQHLILNFNFFSLLLFNPNEIVDDNSMVA